MATGLENLKIYELAERLAVYIYKITKTCPRNEFKAINQLKSSSSSVADNIAEGYGRYTYKDKIHKMRIARGEAEETKMGILRLAKKELIPQKIAVFAAEQYTVLIKMLNGYIKYLEKRHNDE